MSSASVIRSEFADGVTVITLNRPEARNALSSELLAALRQALIDADGDDRVRAVVLTGADPAFCAGLDLKELGSTASNLGAGGPAGTHELGPAFALSGHDQTRGRRHQWARGDGRPGAGAAM